MAASVLKKSWKDKSKKEKRAILSVERLKQIKIEKKKESKSLMNKIKNAKDKKKEYFRDLIIRKEDKVAAEKF